MYCPFTEIVDLIILIVIFITSFSQSQEYKITKLNGFNVRLFNSKVMIANDSISFTYRRRPPLSLKILKIEEIDNKKYIYPEIESPVEESYYTLYSDGRKTFLDQFLIVNGETVELQMQITRID